MNEALTVFIAITRDVSPSIGDCLLTHLTRQVIAVDRARQQHRQYEERLTALGCRVHMLPAEPDLPDSVFVEDTAVVLDELALITRPRAAARQAETPSVAEALRRYRPLSAIQVPDTLDGGDVLRVGRSVFVGLSGRTNREGVEQMRALLSPYGYRVQEVPISGCLHLKSAVTQVAEDTLLINRTWVDAGAFGPMRHIAGHPAEPRAANGLLVGDRVIYPSAYPATRRRLMEGGIALEIVAMSELAKAEGAVTCCSLVFVA